MAEGLHRQIRGKGVNNVNNGYHIFIYIFTNLIGYIFDENPVAEVYTSAVEFVFLCLWFATVFCTVFGSSCS